MSGTDKKPASAAGRAPKRPPAGKVHRAIALDADPVVQALARRADEPLFIVAPGPSSARIKSEHVVGQGAVFRMNMFFLEQAPAFGDVVDAYFWSLNHDALFDGLVEAIDAKRYQVRSFMSPIHPHRVDGDDAKIARARALFSPASDHWAIMAANPVFAREMMGRPLPTQAFQVLATAAMIGFREIHLVGVDMYSDPVQRYAFDYPEELKKKVDPKHYTPGYEPTAHGADRDLRFLEAVRAQFPKTRIFNASDVSPLRHFLPDSPLLAHRMVRELAAAPATPPTVLQRVKQMLPLRLRHALARARQDWPARISRKLARLRQQLPPGLRRVLSGARARVTSWIKRVTPSDGAVDAGRR